MLDGALDPDQYVNDPLDSLDEQTAGFERAISRFMISCAAHQDLCPIGGGDVKGTIDDLIDEADATPIPASNAPDRPVSGDDIRAALAQEVYSPYAWDELRDALVLLQGGDGAGIRAIADGFFGREDDGSYSPGTDRYFLLSADEQHYPRGIQPFLKAGRSSYQDYDYAYWNHGYAELNWGLYPIRARDAFDGPFRTAKSAPTTLVVGTRYDPATPYKEAKRLVQQLGNARLLTMTGDGHTAYDGYPADGYNSECTDKAVEAYLIDGAVPAAGTKCGQDLPDFTAPAAPAKLLKRAGHPPGADPAGHPPAATCPSLLPSSPAAARAGLRRADGAATLSPNGTDRRAAAPGGTRQRARRALAGHRPQRRPQHVRPRGAHAGAPHPGRVGVEGLRDGRPHPQPGPGGGLGGDEGAGGALLGAAQGRGAHDGPARAGVTSSAPVPARSTRSCQT